MDKVSHRVSFTMCTDLFYGYKFTIIDIKRKLTIFFVMAKKNNSMLWSNKLALALLLLAVLLTLLQFIFKTYFDIDLGITFLGHEMF